MGRSAAIAAPRPQGRKSEPGDVFALLKPRVMSLAVFTAAVGLVAAPGSMHPVLAFASVLFIAVGAGGSGALNMWWDADIDARMRRTRGRPIPSGAVERETALLAGLGLSGLAVVMLGLVANLLAAGLLAFAIFFYAVVYTMILKRMTPQNIVIGGAAGALPPVIGWAAATGGIAPEALLMFLLVFVWTPPHFWALALYTRDDYANAGVPMMTVVRGPEATRRLIFAYSAALVPISALIAFSGAGGPAFAAAALAMNGLLVGKAWRVRARDERRSGLDGWEQEKRFFWFSLAYLFGSFAALAVDAALRAALGGLPWWPVLF